MHFLQAAKALNCAYFQPKAEMGMPLRWMKGEKRKFRLRVLEKQPTFLDVGCFFEHSSLEK